MIPQWQGKPITVGWWWLQFPDGPGPRHWDGTFWDRGSYFAAAEDYAENTILGPCAHPAATIPQEAMDHLGDVLLILQNLSPMDGCDALEAAREFYNAANPSARVLPIDGFVTRLVNVGPMDWPLRDGK